MKNKSSTIQIAVKMRIIFLSHQFFGHRLLRRTLVLTDQLADQKTILILFEDC
jgi:hypothetical protein